LLTYPIDFLSYNFIRLGLTRAKALQTVSRSPRETRRRYAVPKCFQHQLQLAGSIQITKKNVGIQLEMKDNLSASFIHIFSPLFSSTPYLHFSEVKTKNPPNLEP